METNKSYLIAKKKRTKNTYFLVLSDDSDIYDIPIDLNNGIAYDDNYKLEDDEWFVISGFSSSIFMIPLLSQDFNSAEFNQISFSDVSNVKYFCSFQNEDYYCFQKFVNGNVIKKKWLTLSGEPEIKTNEPILIIKSLPDAIYQKSTDKLYFKTLSNISSIFPEIMTLYREATDQEVEVFLESDFINLIDDFDKSKVNTANRKRITMAIETLRNLDTESKLIIHEYIKDYCPDLEFDDSKSHFAIGSEESLKNLIFGIEQRFYTTIVGKERRLANSVLKL